MGTGLARFLESRSDRLVGEAPKTPRMVNRKSATAKVKPPEILRKVKLNEQSGVHLSSARNAMKERDTKPTLIRSSDQRIISPGAEHFQKPIDGESRSPYREIIVVVQAQHHRKVTVLARKPQSISGNARFSPYSNLDHVLSITTAVILQSPSSRMQIFGEKLMALHHDFACGLRRFLG